MKLCLLLALCLSRLTVAGSETVAILVYGDDGFTPDIVKEMKAESKEIVKQAFDKEAPEFSYIPNKKPSTRNLEEALLRNFDRALQINQCANKDCSKKGNWNFCIKLGCACTCGQRALGETKETKGLDPSTAAAIKDDIAAKVASLCPGCLFEVVLEDT